MKYPCKLTVQKQDAAFAAGEINHEFYALVYSKTINSINERPMKTETDVDKLNGYIVICSGKSRVYRKCRSFNGVHSGEIELGYRTIAELETNLNQSVCIKPACWFFYFWHCPDNGFKHSFRIAIVGFLVTVISLIIGVSSLILSL